MKKLFLFSLSALALSSAGPFAQEPVPAPAPAPSKEAPAVPAAAEVPAPVPATAPLPTAPEPAPTTPATPQLNPDPADADPLGLIPDLPPMGKKGKGLPLIGPKKSATEQSSDDFQARLRFRKAKTKALLDERIVDAWNAAQEVKTDREKRAGLKIYYTMLYDRMLKLDPTLKAAVDIARKGLVWRLEQRGIRPSEGPGEEEEAEVEVQTLGRNWGGGRS